MATVKMKLLNIIGPYEEFDTCCQRYIVDSSLHLESSILGGISGLLPFHEENPYAGFLKRIEESFAHAEIQPEYQRERVAAFDDHKFNAYIERTDHHLTGLKQRLAETRAELEGYQKLMQQLELMESVDIDIDKFFHLQFIKFRFGKMPKESYKKLQFGIDEIKAFYVPVSTQDDFVWGMYFTTSEYEDQVDYLMNSLYFERVRISDRAKGTPKDALKTVRGEYEQYLQQERELQMEIRSFIEQNQERLQRAYSTVLFQSEAYNIRKYAAHSHDSFYVSGWMPEDEVEEFKRKLEEDELLMCVVEEPESVKEQPPTLLKNRFFARPFEFFVKMYGLPNYHEIDPTLFFSITYFIMFGIMFGDLGHGLVLTLFGFLLYRVKKIQLGGIIFYVGFSSMFFGFLYGEFFGFEELIPTLLIKPMKDSGTMNTILIFAVVFGVFLILSAMVINIINGIRQKDPGKALFSQNGVAGLVFYVSLMVLVVVLLLFGKIVPILVIAGVLMGITFLLIFFKEPLARLIKRKRDVFPQKVSSYVLEEIFEMVEVLLSFATNTISFVRVGAFALNHAGMMTVVMMLMEMAGRAGGVAVLIFGNILVMGLEGLIVGIQVLRLEFYEMFGRFYSGDGKPYRPMRIEQE